LVFWLIPLKLKYLGPKIEKREKTVAAKNTVSMYCEAFEISTVIFQIVGENLKIFSFCRWRSPIFSTPLSTGMACGMRAD